jgi:CBS domain-containing protein
MKKTTRDLMHRGLITCKTTTTLGQVATLLTEHHVHALIVTDRDGRPVGVISDFDLLAGEWLSTDEASLATMRALTAGDMMTTPIDMVEADVPAHLAAHRMVDEGISRLLVTEKGKPAGIVSISDFVASLAETQAVKRETVEDVMSRAMLVCRQETPIVAVARIMTSAHFRSVIVVDDYGKPLGVASGLDLLSFCSEEGCHNVPVVQAMHDALTIHPGATLREAATLMIEKHHHRLVVVDPEHPELIPLGVISSFDIVAQMAQPGSVWQA